MKLNHRKAIELFDAVAQAVDLARSTEIGRVHNALAPFGLDQALFEELCWNGHCSQCQGNCWAEAA